MDGNVGKFRSDPPKVYFVIPARVSKYGQIAPFRAVTGNEVRAWQKIRSELRKSQEIQDRFLFWKIF